MANQIVLTNAKIVLDDEVIHGTLVLEDGLIVRCEKGGSVHGEDMEGDYLIPGLIELHTDHLEAHYAPRPGVKWNAISAVQSHDAQVATSGITTVFDCLRLGSDDSGGFEVGEMRQIADTIERAQEEGRLRADHMIHLRCELPSADLMEHFTDFETDPRVRIVSLMDHSPGQRQFQTMGQYIKYYKQKRGLSDEEFARFVEERQAASERYSALHRKALAENCRARGITIASHDDATIDHVREALDHGVKLAEFPTTVEAARESHQSGMSVLMGAPNVVRGLSHSGNIAARDLAAIGVLDVLSSDYVPMSLIHAPFVLAEEIETIDLPQAMRLVTATPARTVGLEDRGRIAEGLRADIVRVRRDSGVPVVRSVWSAGKRVA